MEIRGDEGSAGRGLGVGMGSWAGRVRARAAFAAAGLLTWGIVHVGAAVPTLISVSPADGATGAGSTTPLVFTFDQVMDKTVPFFPTTPGVPLVGNFEILPASFATQVNGTWSADGRVFTVRPNLSFPLNQTYQWKLNPAGTIFPFKNPAGELLPTVSGAYTTGAAAPAPTLASVVPAKGTTNVPVDVQVVFTFSEAMKTNTAIAGSPPSVPAAVSWSGSGVDPAKFSYSWSPDSRSLSCTYAGGLPVGATVAWILNPPTAPVKLEGTSGRAVAASANTGSFVTVVGVPGCDPDGVPDTWGQYSVYKTANFEQAAGGEPTPAVEDPATSFSAVIFSPQFGPFVTAATLTKPNGSISNLVVIGGLGQLITAPGTEAALDLAFPSGSYVLKFTQTGQPERVVSLSLPSNPPPTPRIGNLTAARSIPAGSDFTLRWDAFSGAGAGDLLSFMIDDGAGNVVFQAPDACVPRPLAVGATSIVIPAGVLLSNKTYVSTLSFGRMFLRDTNSIPQMAGYAGLLRSTRFELKTTGGSLPPAAAAEARAARVLESGQPQFDVTGSAGRSYGVQRTASLTSPVWAEVGTLTLDAAGAGTFTDPQLPVVLPAFYRLVGK
jgi:hypothetical protein